MGAQTGNRNDAVQSANLLSASDLELIRNGDRTAQDRLVKNTGPIVLAMAHRFLDCPEEINDVFQETYLNAFRSLDQFRGDSALSTWLTAIARNCALNKLRKRNRLHVSDRTTDTIEYGEFGLSKFPKTRLLPDFEVLLETRENRLLVRQAIMKLPAIYRTAVLMKDIEGLSLKEISLQLDISLSAVKVRIHRARNALRSQLLQMLEADEGF